MLLVFPFISVLTETACILTTNWKGEKWALAFFPLLFYKAILSAYFKNKTAIFLTWLQKSFLSLKNQVCFLTGRFVFCQPVKWVCLTFFYAVVYRPVKNSKQTFLSLAMYTLASLPITHSSGSDSSLGFLAVHLGSSYKLARELIVVTPSYTFPSLADWQLVLL